MTGTTSTTRTTGAAGLPAYGDDAPDGLGAAAAPASGARAGSAPGSFGQGLLTRRGHALGVSALIVATAGFSVPLWGEIHDKVVERVDTASEGAIGIGTSIAWCTSLLANVLTLGLLGVLVGALGAVATRHLPLPGDVQGAGGADDFTRLRRAFTLGWAAFVLAKLTAWTAAGLALGHDVSRAVPTVTHLDAWLPLLPCALLLAARAAGSAWPRAAATAAAVTAAYATALWLLPS
ncbi:hypothetical protein [Streptomyces sp. NRRL B-1347]|uniref:hypothetical protein n=1 Tax=Streptomyces sp. NRRL B-1347 TaxID=1476877 RepID=UPI0004CC3838|nr:hypothetical protein [Streptomyces sp. NRRL B-1347]